MGPGSTVRTWCLRGSWPPPFPLQSGGESHHRLARAALVRGAMKRCLFFVVVAVFGGCEGGTDHPTRAERVACHAFAKLLEARAAAVRGEQQPGVDLVGPHYEPTPSQLATYDSRVKGFRQVLDALPDRSGPESEHHAMFSAGVDVYAAVTRAGGQAADPRTELPVATDGFAHFANECGRFGVRV